MIDLSRKIFFFVAFLASAGCVPNRSPKSGSQDVDKTFIGEGTNDLAQALLQGSVGEDDNMAYSPLGYSAVLAIFAEGAKGESREEIATALRFPEDINAVRLAYKTILQNLHGSEDPNRPQFKNWFYIYKNYTIEEELTEILKEHYLTEVKRVERPDEYVRGGEKEKLVVEEQTGEAQAEAPEKNGKDEVMIAEQRSADEKSSPPGQDHFSGMTDSSLKIKGKGPQSQMIIFNGLYFKGDWKEPFVKKSADENRVFYKSESQKISTSTISSQGEFNVGDVAQLDSKAIELPYKGDRYSLLVLLPNKRDGLPKLISDLAVYPMNDIYKHMKTKFVDVCLPSFEIDCISKPITSFAKLGLSKVKSIFDPEKADLSGISKEPGLYVEELVQMVSFRVDAEYSSANFITAAVEAVRSNYESFHANRPFLFFLKDKINDIIVVNGKVVDPTPKPEFFTS